MGIVSQATPPRERGIDGDLVGPAESVGYGLLGTTYIAKEIRDASQLNGEKSQKY